MEINKEKQRKILKEWIEEDESNELWDILVSKSFSLLENYSHQEYSQYSNETIQHIDDMRDYCHNLIRNYSRFAENSEIGKNCDDIVNKHIFFDTVLIEMIDEMTFFAELIENRTLVNNNGYSVIFIRYLFHSFFSKIDVVRSNYELNFNYLKNIDLYYSSESFRNKIFNKNIVKKVFQIYNSKTKKYDEIVDDTLIFNNDLNLIQLIRNQETHKITDLAKRLNNAILYDENINTSSKFGEFWVIFAMLIYTINHLNLKLKSFKNENNKSLFYKYFELD